MSEQTFSETADFEFKVVAPDSWEEQMAEVRKAGMEKSAALRQQGHAFHVEILGTRRVQSPKSVPLAAVMMNLDWRLAAKLEMVEAARDLITNAHVLDSLDGALPTVLSAVIEGRGLFEYSMGEFFTLYGTFEGKHRVQGERTRAKMLKLVNGDERYLKPYVERGKERKDPLPYAVRNILAHSGHNPNTLDPNGNELKTSVDLLRQWTGKPRAEREASVESST